uniref:Secreted protein n=1 Tax=Chromera velia CCMP2878 TaxID=1169474 RepID=A0A0G4I611_9ALVE|eukprot:Cvel_11258.t1-p1 / transcript=Cvel_11258.t1 / gene=Cvel_11258 / organism=Chromera_velia_CCMP2878 / gene_product=hypothetical protein / transcript_product=hypothetical protein / location=Cvel_scaffold702:14246-16083(+) / protein_length=100 / sequence_SO=supercontig / SO=protein_coding / is_pseudo=false
MIDVACLVLLEVLLRLGGCFPFMQVDERVPAASSQRPPFVRRIASRQILKEAVHVLGGSHLYIRSPKTQPSSRMEGGQPRYTCHRHYTLDGAGESSLQGV